MPAQTTAEALKEQLIKARVAEDRAIKADEAIGVKEKRKQAAWGKGLINDAKNQSIVDAIANLIPILPLNITTAAALKAARATATPPFSNSLNAIYTLINPAGEAIATPEEENRYLEAIMAAAAVESVHIKFRKNLDAGNSAALKSLEEAKAVIPDTKDELNALISKFHIPFLKASVVEELSSAKTNYKKASAQSDRDGIRKAVNALEPKKIAEKLDQEIQLFARSMKLAKVHVEAAAAADHPLHGKPNDHVEKIAHMAGVATSAAFTKTNNQAARTIAAAVAAETAVKFLDSNYKIRAALAKAAGFAAAEADTLIQAEVKRLAPTTPIPKDRQDLALLVATRNAVNTFVTQLTSIDSSKRNEAALSSFNLKAAIEAGKTLAKNILAERDPRGVPADRADLTPEAQAMGDKTKALTTEELKKPDTNAAAKPYIAEVSALFENAAKAEANHLENNIASISTTAKKAVFKKLASDDSSDITIKPAKEEDRSKLVGIDSLATDPGIIPGEAIKVTWRPENDRLPAGYLFGKSVPREFGNNKTKEQICQTYVSPSPEGKPGLTFEPDGSFQQAKAMIMAMQELRAKATPPQSSNQITLKHIGSHVSPKALINFMAAAKELGVEVVRSEEIKNQMKEIVRDNTFLGHFRPDAVEKEVAKMDEAMDKTREAPLAEQAEEEVVRKRFV